MTISLYDVSVRSFIQTLTGTAGYLDKAAKHFEAAGKDPNSVLDLRLFDDMLPFAAMLDTAWGGDRYGHTLAMLRQRIDNPELCPSAQVLEAAREHGGFFRYAMAISQRHRASLLAQPLEGATLARFTQAAEESLQKQQEIEAADTGSFEDFVASYYA